jgi:anti-anti-sigma factor
VTGQGRPVATPGPVVVAAAGEIDMLTVGKLREAVFGALAAGAAHALLVVDLREVAFLSSAGLGVPVELADATADREVALRIVAATQAVLRAIVASPAHRQRSGGRTLRSWIGPWIVIDYVSAKKI